MNVNPNAGLPTQPPSLFGNTVPAMPAPQRSHAALEASCLLDLMYDGFYMLFLLRNQQATRRTPLGWAGLSLGQASVRYV